MKAALVKAGMVRTGTTRRRRGLVAGAVVLVVLAGCSGGGGGKSGAPSTSGPGGTAANGPTTTARPVDTSFTGQGSAEFCTLARTYNDRFTKVSANPSAAELRTLAREGQTAISQAAAAAPPEIRPDVAVISAAFTALLAELEKVNFEAAKLPVSALSLLQAPEFARSTTRFQAYTRTVCGVTG